MTPQKQEEFQIFHEHSYRKRSWCSTTTFAMGGYEWIEVLYGDIKWFVVRNKNGIFFRIWEDGDQNFMSNLLLNFVHDSKVITDDDIKKMNHFPVIVTHKETDNLFDYLRSIRYISPSGKYQKGISWAAQITVNNCNEVVDGMRGFQEVVHRHSEEAPTNREHKCKIIKGVYKDYEIPLYDNLEEYIFYCIH